MGAACFLNRLVPAVAKEAGFGRGDCLARVHRPGVLGLRLMFVNVFAIEGGEGWTLVEAGLYGTADRIRR